MNRKILAKAWIILGAASLILSGILTLPILAGKVPALKAMIVNLEWIRWCLVVHVNLSNLVWFTAIPVGLVQLSIIQDKWSRAQRNSILMGFFGFIISVVGVILMTTSFLQPGVEIVLSNYLPVLTHKRFFLGLILYCAGVVLNFISPEAILPWARCPISKSISGIFESRFGLWIGSLYFLSAVLVTVAAYFSTQDIGAVSSRTYYEIVMWGGGHLLQHSSSVFLIAVWIALLSAALQKELYSRLGVFPFFAWLGLPIFAVPIIALWPASSSNYREGFSWLMRFGIAPPILAFATFTIFKLYKMRHSLKQCHFFTNPELIAVALSAWLLVLGFIFGSFIQGSDMRIPGHYHATIGAVTIAFMAFCANQLSSRAVLSRKWLSLAFWAYGLGQTIFASGMFIAGSFGIQRKTYGSEIQILNLGQKLGFGLLSLGGLIALFGGSLFGLILIQIFLKRRKINENKSTFVTDCCSTHPK